MEQDVDSGYRTVCTTCLSTDRDLYSLSNLPQINQIFKLLMFDFAADRLADMPDIEQLVCWECLALMKRFLKFKWQVQNAQDHLRILSLSRTQESMDHTYMSQSLSSLEVTTKTEYDRMYLNFISQDEKEHYLEISGTPLSVKREQYDGVPTGSNNISLDIQENILEVPEMVLDNTMTHIVVGNDHNVVNTSENFTMTLKRQTMPVLTVGPIGAPDIEAVIVCQKAKVEEKDETKQSYITQYMTEAELQACREEAKLKVKYASSAYKCELCIIGFYNQQQVRDHFVTAHKVRPGAIACKVCFMYIDENKLSEHTEQHYYRYICKLCGFRDQSKKSLENHSITHSERQPNALIKIGDTVKNTKGRKKKQESQNALQLKPGDLRKMLSKTTIECYQCLECDMFFKNSRARKTHVMRFHREGFQCDHCKKRFVNRTTLATHLRLHEGPLPREECPICHKMVRKIQLKYHIQRHQNKGRYECVECKKIFSHLATYQAHFKYSRAHATDQIFKFPCPMCNKGYQTKEQMQDHFNYQHLGKTAYKCPLCEKPIASRKNVERHMMRVHGERKEKPRNHVCQSCGNAFTCFIVSEE
ncbi:hypothetical protein K1T71_000697 [Dendrolimus kikuchii]|uniref:Uncharacterized protein n=1 Tax=Dendrolimus kikuchii TaxID=765133 RepID=A0ACC1DJX7_9NEOP|nr:hypothetical protein K1T71_000697 [Dendrolimus kikuchii]